MKKFWVLFSLFILPLVFYLFLSKGIYRYANLPILAEEVIAPDNNPALFKGHFTVVCFPGDEVSKAKASLFNLNQTIYKRYYQKPLFQMVAILPEDSEAAYTPVIEELAAFTDTKAWTFLYKKRETIEAMFRDLKTPFSLQESLFSENAYIVDRELRLRGRKDDEDSTDGKLYGYDTRSVSVLKHKMKDDLDIIYYQLKKSEEKKKRRQRKI